MSSEDNCEHHVLDKWLNEKDVYECRDCLEAFTVKLEELKDD